MSWVVHWRWRVYFNQPNFIIAIDHEIITKEFMSILAILNSINSTHQWMLYNFLHLWLYFILKYIISLKLLQVFLTLLLEKHVSFNMWFIKIFVVCTNRIVCEMDEFIANLFRIIVNRWETNIALIKHPNC